MKRRAGWRGAVAVFAALAARVDAAPKEGDVIVVVDVSEAGKKVAPPSPEHPAFYVPLVIGYREEGGVLGGEKAPPPKDVVLRHFAKTLAEQGYRVVAPGTGEPTLLLVFSWGSWNPLHDTMPIEASPDETESNLPPPGPGELTRTLPSTNGRNMLALVAGNTVKNIPWMPSNMTNTELENVTSDAADNRYFAVVAAFDWAAAQEKKRVILWSAKMSIRSTGVWLDEILPAMIASGGPFFGRETLERQQVAVPLVRDGKVELGELQNKGVVGEPTPSAAGEPAPEAAEKTGRTP